MSDNKQVPFGSFGFKVSVKLDGSDTATGCFQEVSGLSAQLNVEDVMEGGVNDHVHKVITGASYSNIILKRGLCSTDMFNVIQGFITGASLGKRLSGTIEISDESGNKKRFSFKRGIPVKWDGPSLSVTSDAIATETLEIAHEGLEVK